MDHLASEDLEPLIAALAAFGFSLRSFERELLSAAARGDSDGLRRRLDRAEVAVQAALDRMADDAADWIEDVLPVVFLAAAVEAARSVPQAGVPALVGGLAEGLAVRQDDLWESAAAAFRFAGEDLARFSSDVRRVAAAGGVAGETRAEAIERVVRAMRRRGGLATVTYSNGLRYPIDAHLSTLFNTHTVLAQAEARVREWSRFDVRFVELSDGVGCGLFAHKIGPLADGMIVPIELYQAFPIAHPNCVRSAIGRPDLVDGPDGPVSLDPGDAVSARSVLDEATAVLAAEADRLSAVRSGR